jgi:hypothetical protein
MGCLRNEADGAGIESIDRPVVSQRVAATHEFSITLGRGPGFPPSLTPSHLSRYSIAAASLLVHPGWRIVSGRFAPAGVINFA